MTTALTTAPSARSAAAQNEAVAAALDEVAELLERQHANQYRVAAWRGAAHVIRGLDETVGELLAREGLGGLDRLPGIGPALARAIHEYATTGHLGTLDRLRGDTDPEALLASMPGVGPVLARRLRETHGIETLEELEQAAHDGRLATVPGFGPKRVAGVADALAGRFGRRARARHAHPHAPATGLPPVEELLDVDREYRARVRDGSLARIAPRRFNPSHRAWLPVLHTTRGDRHYTALFSNTPLAHRLRRTRDWVVIYLDGRDGERQCTVVSERQGALAGHRVVRGRELECLELARGMPPHRQAVAGH